MSGEVRLRRHVDARGHLVAVTGGDEVPFQVRRVFWIYGNAGGLARAGHANAVTTEMLVSVSGSCRARLEDDDGVRTFTLDRPDTAVLIPPRTWLDLTDFTPDCVLLVLTDTEYSPDETISDRALLWKRG